MAIYYFPMRYQFGAAGEPEEVKADQRDVAAWEAEPFGAPVTGELVGQPITFWRYLAWSASKRAGRHGMSWKAWQDDCIWADYLPEDVAEDAEDPGPPGQSATP